MYDYTIFFHIFAFGYAGVRDRGRFEPTLPTGIPVFMGILGTLAHYTSPTLGNVFLHGPTFNVIIDYIFCICKTTIFT